MSWVGRVGAIAGVLVIGVLAFPIAHHVWVSRRQGPVQARILQRCFYSIERQGDRVFLTPTVWGRFHVTFPSESRDLRHFREPVLQTPGFRFGLRDRHWGADYVVHKLRPEGVVIRFVCWGSDPSSIRPGSGEVLLPWRAPPAVPPAKFLRSRWVEPPPAKRTGAVQR